MTTPFQPSPYQLAIGDAVDSPSGPNILVEAVAGSGKTTTLLWLLDRIPQRKPNALLSQSICFLAFNKNIAETLKSRCPSYVSCSTFHSLGLRALKTCSDIDPTASRRRDFVDSRKVPKLVWKRLDRDNPDTQAIIRLVGLLKSLDHVAEAFDVASLIQHHELDFADPRAATSVALDVLEESNRNLDQIDFDDMLYLPVLLNATFSTQDWLLVDECQDLNSIQHEILARSAGPSTRIIAVGDRHQAIYGFRGASADSMEKLQSRFNMTELPLSISYRCPKAVVAEAQKALEQPL